MRESDVYPIFGLSLFQSDCSLPAACLQFVCRLFAACLQPSQDLRVYSLPAVCFQLADCCSATAVHSSQIAVFAPRRTFPAELPTELLPELLPEIPLQSSSPNILSLSCFHELLLSAQLISAQMLSEQLFFCSPLFLFSCFIFYIALILYFFASFING